MTSDKRIAVVVSYPATDPKTGDALKFDMDYYLAKHMPLIDKVRFTILAQLNYLS